MRIKGGQGRINSREPQHRSLKNRNLRPRGHLFTDGIKRVVQTKKRSSVNGQTMMIVSGRTVTVYDPASNPVKKITANLAAAKKAITYDYEYNRLQAIHYPISSANDVSYEYGAANLLGNGSNQVGRLVKVTDASGSQERHYGKLGETIKEIRTIASHTQGQSKNSPEVYVTQYRYDSFGRLLELVLPDSEVSRPTVRDTSGASIPPVFFAQSAWHHAINQANPAETRQKSVSQSADAHVIPPIWRIQASDSPDSPSIPSNGKRAG